MAEKPRLKKSDEILGSIASDSSRGRGKAGDRRPARKDEREEAVKIADLKLPEPDDEEELDPSEQQVVLPSAQSLAEKLMARDDKRRQLNFAKYELPGRGTAPQNPAVQNVPPAQNAAPAASAPVTFETQTVTAPDISFDAPPSVTFGVTEPQSPAQPQKERQPRIFNAPVRGSAAPTAQTFEAPAIPQATFSSFDDGRADGTPREFDLQGGQRGARERTRRKQPKSEDSSDEEIRHEPETVSQQAVYEPRPTPKIIPFIETEFEPEPKPEPKPKPAIKPEPKPEPEPEVSEREKVRQDFLKRLESQFKTQFEEKFEEGTLKEREAMRRAIEAARPSAPVEPEPVAEPKRPRLEVPTPKSLPPEPDFTSVPDANPDEDFLEMVQRQERERMEREAAQKAAEAPVRDEPAGFFDAPSRSSAEPQSRGMEDAPALDFISRFEREVKEEEEVQTKDFQETLAEKFERERERYLKELDVKVPEPKAEEPVQPQRKKLDFQIQPEMHISSDAVIPKPQTKPAAAPVTYTRGAVATPQSPVADIPAPDTAQAVKPPAGKKTSEQLLMEHGQRAKSSAIKPANKKPETLNFTFSTPEEQEKEQENKKAKKASIVPTDKWPRRIFIISAMTGLFAIGLLAIPIVRYIQLMDRVIGPDTSAAVISGLAEDTLSIYENRSFTETAKYKNAVFKSAGLTLTNVDVSEYVTIEGIDSKGKIRLENVSVGSAVSLKSGGVNLLELHNVKAERVIINNAANDVSIIATGDTDIEMVELRTPAAIRQSDISDTAPGIRGVIVTSPEDGGAMNATLDRLNLRSLETQASESVLVFENGTRAENMSSDGSLSLSGSGRVMSLSIGARVGQGAGDASDAKDVSLLVKGVTITNLNVKSSAVLNLATSVDNVSTAHSVMLGGGGTVGTLTLNAGSDSVRLPVDVAGLNVQSIYANTASRVNITGSATVNTFTADASSYVLGNKVNYLIVNANDVIYENEPDEIKVANGIRPPQSVAENPNLNLDAGTSAANGDILSAIGDEFSTTCGHSRESGGFVIGNGSLEAPYEVVTAMQLSHVGVHPESYFIQSGDIDIASESKFSGGFPMICSLTEPFAGVYNGGGFAISNLRINSENDSIGLFAASKGIIENVRLISGSVTATSAKLANAGGIVGANMAGGQVRSSSNGAVITGGSLTSAGGIAGYNRGKVHDCYNYAKISGAYQVGGLVGLIDGTGSITGSYNAGVIEATSAETGAVAGKNDGATVANCYFLEDTFQVGIGDGTGTATPKSSEYLSSFQMVADLAAGNDASLWTSANAPVNGYGYPVHKQP